MKRKGKHENLMNKMSEKYGKKTSSIRVFQKNK